MNTQRMDTDMRVLMNHIYEFKKGIRQMVLYTFNMKYEALVKERLQHQNIPYLVHPVGNGRLNLFFGRKECLDAIRLFVTKPLNQLTPEEDFILGLCWGMIFECSASGIASANAALAIGHSKHLSSIW